MCSHSHAGDINIVNTLSARYVGMLEEQGFLAKYHHMIQKKRKKAWHDRHIRNKYFAQDDLVSMYDSKFWKHLRKLKMHW